MKRSNVILNEKRVAILQSNYIPWKGYFDLIDSVDEFILFDDVQYTKRDWRNRNLIKTPNGLQWLSIPVQTKGNYCQKICEVKVSDSKWADNHWQSITYNYRKAKYFSFYEELFLNTYMLAKEEVFLSNINYLFLKKICELLTIKTSLTWSKDYNVDDQSDRNHKLLALCKAASATCYISGPSAKAYLDESLFKKEGINVSFFNYCGYKKYPQLYSDFEHSVSIIDLLFNTGNEAITYIRRGIL